MYRDCFTTFAGRAGAGLYLRNCPHSLPPPFGTPSRRSSQIYSSGKDAGACFLKASVLPGPMMRPACTTCKGVFYQMTGPPAYSNSSFGGWTQPRIVERGVDEHQLYSQITFPFYDVRSRPHLACAITNAAHFTHVLLVTCRQVDVIATIHVASIVFAPQAAHCLAMHSSATH